MPDYGGNDTCGNKHEVREFEPLRDAKRDAAKTPGGGIDNPENGAKDVTDDRTSGKKPESWREIFLGYQLMVLLSCFMCAFIDAGVAYTVSIFHVAWIDEFGSGSGMTSWLGSLNIGVLLTTAPLSSYLTERFGFRPVAMVGGLVSTGGMIASAFADSIYTLLVTFSIISSIGIGLVLVPYYTIVPQYFSGRGLVLANGIFTSGGGFGNFIMPYILDASINRYHWRGAMFIMACVTLQMCVCGALMKAPPSWREKQKEKKLQAEKPAQSHFHIYKNAGMLLYLVQVFFIRAGLSVVYVHITAYTEVIASTTRSRATLAISLLGLFNLFGRIAAGLISQHQNINPYMYYLVCMTLTGLFTILMPLFGYFECIVTWAALFGFLSAPVFALLLVMILHFVDLADLSTVFAHVNIFSAVGYTIGAPLAGWLYDYTNDYRGSFFLGGSFLCFGSFLLIFPYLKHRVCGQSSKMISEENASKFGSVLGSQYFIDPEDEEKRG